MVTTCTDHNITPTLTPAEKRQVRAEELRQARMKHKIAKASRPGGS